jgi:hypothetical protein
MPNNDTKAVALAFLEAVANKRFDAFDALLDPEVSFHGPAGVLSGVRDVSAAYRRVANILIRNDLKRLFVDGDEACLIYDFVTDTSSGAVPTMEWLTLQHGKVRRIQLLVDHKRWPPALEELAKRLQQKAP